jgi:hypothetical protein
MLIKPELITMEQFNNATMSKRVIETTTDWILLGDARALTCKSLFLRT